MGTFLSFSAADPEAQYWAKLQDKHARQEFRSGRQKPPIVMPSVAWRLLYRNGEKLVRPETIGAGDLTRQRMCEGHPTIPSKRDGTTIDLAIPIREDQREWKS